MQLNPILKSQEIKLLHQLKQNWYLNKIYEKAIFVLGFFSLIAWIVFALFKIL